MKARPILILSALLNFALVGGIGYLLGTRSGHQTAPGPTLASSSVHPSSKTFVDANSASDPVEALISPKPAGYTLHQATASSAPVQSLSAAAPFSPQIPTAPIYPPASVPSPIANSAPVAVAQPSTISDGTITQQVDPSAGGNSFSSNGMRVSVAETISPITGNSRPSLAIDIAPASSAGITPNSPAASIGGDISPNTSSSGDLAAGTQSIAAPGNANIATVHSNGSNSTTPNQQTGAISTNGAATATQTPPSLANQNSEPTDRWGLTAEEEQFRTKWGPAALDEARTAAREQAAQ